MLAFWIGENFHQDERALLALDDPGHGPKWRASNIVACSASPSIACSKPVSASASASSVLHAM